MIVDKNVETSYSVFIKYFSKLLGNNLKNIFNSIRVNQNSKYLTVSKYG